MNQEDKILSHRRATAKYRRKNKELIRFKQNEKNRYNSEVRRDRKLKERYGITLAEYDVILSKQKGGCWICGRTTNQGIKKLSVDHNHETGKVRGILCYACNTAIGMLNEDLALFMRAMDYLNQHD